MLAGPDTPIFSTALFDAANDCGSAWDNRSRAECDAAVLADMVLLHVKFDQAEAWSREQARAMTSLEQKAMWGAVAREIARRTPLAGRARRHADART